MMHRGIAKRRRRSAARWATGSRSILIVPQKRGNPDSSGDPVEGSGMSDHGTVFGKYDECIEIRVTYQRNRNG